MGATRIRKLVIVLTHALIGWALCGSIMGIGMNIMPMKTTLIVHAIGAPIFFAIISAFYFRRFNFTTPLQTAVIFLAIVVFMDFFIVAFFIEKSFEMFSSLMGTWLPFALIFSSTFITPKLSDLGLDKEHPKGYLVVNKRDVKE